MSKVPSHSPTHEDIEPGRLAAMGLELEDIAAGDEVELPALVELAEDRGRPPSHYVAAVALATELRIAGAAPLALHICAGNCQRYGALDVIDGLLAARVPVRLHPVSCLDRCDRAPACELRGDHGALAIAPATVDAIADAVRAL